MNIFKSTSTNEVSSFIFFMTFAIFALVALIMALIPLYQILETFSWLNSLQPLSLAVL